MKKGLIIYSAEDIEKNRGFLEICKDKFLQAQIEIELLVLNDEEMKWQQNAPWSQVLMDFRPVDFAINRSRNVGIATYLENRGVRVFNSSKVTFIGNDKWQTYLYANSLGVPVMETMQGCNKKEDINDNCNNNLIPYPRVIKSLNGHGGSEVFLVNNLKEEQHIFDKINKEYIVQKLADAKGRDIRVYIIGGEIVVAMCRKSKEGFKSNFSLGGDAKVYTLNDAERKMVNKIVEDLNPDYVGIDLIYDNERLVLNEIEDAVGARMVYSNTDIPIVEKYVEYMIKNVLSK